MLAVYYQLSDDDWRQRNTKWNLLSYNSWIDCFFFFPTCILFFKISIFIEHVHGDFRLFNLKTCYAVPGSGFISIRGEEFSISGWIIYSGLFQMVFDSNLNKKRISACSTVDYCLGGGLLPRRPQSYQWGGFDYCHMLASLGIQWPLLICDIRSILHGASVVQIWYIYREANSTVN